MKMELQARRDFLKEEFTALKTRETDLKKGLPYPPVEKPYDPESVLVELENPDNVALVEDNLVRCMENRRSVRRYSDKPLTLAELSYLLWATQGVHKVLGEGKATLRTVPSGGARHPLETYLVVNRVENLAPAVYRYLPVEHKLLFLYDDPHLKEKIIAACDGQQFVGDSAVVFAWSAIPYRGEYKYDIAAHKMILLDAGHTCQNLYLACESIGCGTCAVGDYHQKAVDQMFRLDGQDEFIIYLAPVGKKLK